MKYYTKISTLLICLLLTNSAFAAPTCSSSVEDLDGNGWGWENNNSCIIVNSHLIPCDDPDGDGWGWDGEKSCRTESNTYDNTLSAPPSSRLHVCGTKLCEGNNEIQLVGMSTHGIHWENAKECLTENSFSFLANNWNANLIRIAMYVEEGGYKQNRNLSNEVQNLIDIASNLGMYVIVDFHILTPGDPVLYTGLAKEFFQDIVTRNKDRTNILYEIANEPNGKINNSQNGAAVDWARIKSYAEEVIPVIRKIDPGAIIIVGTKNWSSFGLADNGSYFTEMESDLLDYENLMYAFHFYAAESSHIRNDYYRELEKTSQEIPVFVTEWGTSHAHGGSSSGNTEIDAYRSREYAKMMKENKISWANWNFSQASESSAVWKSGTCHKDKWEERDLTPSGNLMKQLFTDKKYRCFGSDCRD